MGRGQKLSFSQHGHVDIKLKGMMSRITYKKNFAWLLKTMLCGTRAVSARSVGICDGMLSTARSSFV